MTSAISERTFYVDHIRVTIYYTETSQNVGMMHIASTVTMYQPGVSPGSVAVGMQHISDPPTMHSPGVSPGSVSIAANHIASTATLYEPLVTLGGSVVGMEHIAATTTLYEPEVIGPQYIGMNAIASTVTLYEPTVVFTQSIGMETIASTATLYLLTVTTGPKTSSILVASPRRDPLFYVAIYPHPSRPNSGSLLDTIDINPDLTGISWTTTLPGGFARFTAGFNNHERPLADPLLPRELRWQDFAHMELTDGAATLWEGRMEDRDESPRERRTLTAQGWGYTATKDNPFFSDSATAATSGAILRTVLAYAAPFLRPAFGDLYIDPQVSHTPAEFDAWYPSQVLDQITKEGDDSGNLMDWAVWEGRLLTLKPRVAPSTADYYLPFDRRYVTDWKRIAADRRGQVWVDHTVSGVATRTGPVSATGFTDDVGFQRGRVLKAGEMSVSAATQLALTHITTYSQARYTGTVTIGPDDVLIGRGGQPVPAYLARAGQWVQVGDYGPLVIVVQEYNANARRQKLTLGDRADTYDVKVAQTIREAELRKLGSDPVGGRI